MPREEKTGKTKRLSKKRGKNKRGEGALLTVSVRCSFTTFTRSTERGDSGDTIHTVFNGIKRHTGTMENAGDTITHITPDAGDKETQGLSTGE